MAFGWVRLAENRDDREENVVHPSDAAPGEEPHRGAKLQGPAEQINKSPASLSTIPNDLASEISY
jgi:hypothetical protein